MIKRYAKKLAKSLYYSVALDPKRYRNTSRYARMHSLRAELTEQVFKEAQDSPAMFASNVCPVCGKDESTPAFQNPQGYTYSTCRNDGMLFMNPVPSEETLARLYNGPAEDLNSLGEEKNGKAIAPTMDKSTRVACNRRDFNWIVENLPESLEGADLLDVGCSTGGFMYAAKDYFKPQGVDLNETCTAAARKVGFEAFTGRLDDVPGEKRFGMITMLQVIEHIVDPRSTLDQVFRLLKPGGYFYVATPNMESSSFAYLGRYHSLVKGFKHVSLFTLSTLKMLGERCGFECVKQAYDDLGTGSDLALHDAITFAISKKRFMHRMCFYSPRLYNFCNFVDLSSFGLLSKLVLPKGHPSYQRALFRRPLDDSEAR